MSEINMNEDGSTAVVQALIRKIEEREQIIREIVSQCDQGGDFGKVFARDNCIQEARKVLR